MTPDQMKLYSREWQQCFYKLDFYGYKVRYVGGIIRISNRENSMAVILERGAWLISLDSPWRESDRVVITEDDFAIQTIYTWLNRAARHPEQYSYAALEAATAKAPDLSVPKGGFLPSAVIKYRPVLAPDSLINSFQLMQLLTTRVLPPPTLPRVFLRETQPQRRKKQSTRHSWKKGGSKKKRWRRMMVRGKRG